MKKIVFLVMTVATLVIANPVQAQEKAKWNEKEAFHEIMSKTFHPAEEGKLEPIKSRSAEMVDIATAWKNSTAPEGYNQKAIQKNLKSLVKDAKKLNKLVKKNA
ncbi:MAG: hypothetical protein WBO38_02790, partial [Chitinophagaceae bacterium]